VSYFTVRVELREPVAAADYTKLHAEMEKTGFSRQIGRIGEPKHHLPQAEYNEVGEFTIAQVLERAIKAAAATGKQYSVLVTQSEVARAWYNLERVA
jgi:hypothetical protein